MHVHAYLITAVSIESAALSEELKSPSIDTHHIIAEKFGIEDARALTIAAYKKPVAGPYRSFVIAAAAMTREAQNALLKLLEEPPQSTVFYILVPHESLLLPTLRSRLLAMAVTSASPESEFAAEFLKKPLADRLARIADLQKQKDVKSMQALVLGIGNLAAQKDIQLPKAALETLLFVESRLRVVGGSKKMLLEHLALALPVMAK